MAISNAQLKLLNSLKLKKFRQRYNKYLVEGPKMVQELLVQAPNAVDVVFGTKEYLEKLPSSSLKVTLVEISEKDLSKLSSFSTANQAIAIAHIPNIESWSRLGAECLSIFTDAIQDPGNLGTIIRIADWFGIKTLICGSGTVDPYSPKVVQSSMGAIFRVDISFLSLDKIKEINPAVKIFGAVLDRGRSIYETSPPKGSILVIGNESNGIQSSNSKWIDEEVNIPRLHGNGAESLNAAIACGIICGQWIKPS